MGRAALIARRVASNVLQFGNISDDGDLEYVGPVLHKYYNTPEGVKKLFALGQLQLLGAPGSEELTTLFDPETDLYCTKYLDGYFPHDICTSENDLESGSMYYCNYYYFYDFDDHWYFVKPTENLMLKIPLDYLNARMSYLKKDHCESTLMNEMEEAYLKELLFEYPKKDPEFKKLLESCIPDLEKTYSELMKKKNPLDTFITSCKDLSQQLLSYFDKWSVFDVGAENEPIIKVHLRKASEKHVETYLWDSPNNGSLPISSQEDEIDLAKNEVIDAVKDLLKDTLSAKDLESLERLRPPQKVQRTAG